MTLIVWNTVFPIASDIEVESNCEGTPFDSYLDWQASNY